MDDLLQEFLTETNESLDTIDVELVRFEQEPNNAKILDNIFRLVHTIKGTCGFLGLPRLAALAHAAETLMGKFRDGMKVTGESVTLVLFTIDRIKDLLTELEECEREPAGDDSELISELERMAVGPKSQTVRNGERSGETVGTIFPQVLQRALRPGEVSLDELERAFRTTPGPTPTNPPEPAKPAREKAPAEKDDDDKSDGKGNVANHSIRVNVDVIENLMTMVSELVLTRNQLLRPGAPAERTMISRFRCSGCPHHRRPCRTA